MINELNEQYEKKAKGYLKMQEEFYLKNPDKSREQLYVRFNFPLKSIKMLDVGCGFGKDVKHFQDSGAIVFGIDSSEEMISLAKQKYSSLNNLSVQNYENTSFSNSFFDCIYSRYASHYSLNLDQAFKEFNRILRPNGYLILLVAHPLLSFIAKKEKVYNKQETVEIPLYNNTITIKEPSHTFSDYFCPALKNNFELIDFYENDGEENSENGFSEIVPDYMILSFRKK